MNSGNDRFGNLIRAKQRMEMTNNRGDSLMSQCEVFSMLDQIETIKTHVCWPLSRQRLIIERLFLLHLKAGT
jgi:hypothetical protein